MKKNKFKEKLSLEFKRHFDSPKDFIKQSLFIIFFPFAVMPGWISRIILMACAGLDFKVAAAIYNVNKDNPVISKLELSFVPIVVFIFLFFITWRVILLIACGLTPDDRK